MVLWDLSPRYSSTMPASSRLRPFGKHFSSTGPSCPAPSCSKAAMISSKDKLEQLNQVMPFMENGQLEGSVVVVGNTQGLRVHLPQLLHKLAGTLVDCNIEQSGRLVRVFFDFMGLFRPDCEQPLSNSLMGLSDCPPQSESRAEMRSGRSGKIWATRLS